MPKEPSLVRRRSSRQSKVLGELNSTTAFNQVQRSKTMPKQRPVMIQKPKALVHNVKQLTQHLIDWLENQFMVYFSCDYATQVHNASYFCYTDFEKAQKRLFDMQRVNVHNCLFNANDFLKVKINGLLSGTNVNRNN